MDILELKNNIMENVGLKKYNIWKLDGLNSKMEMIEKRVSELGDRSIDVIQSEEQWKKLKEKKKNITLGLCGKISVCVTVVPEGKEWEKNNRNGKCFSSLYYVWPLKIKFITFWRDIYIIYNILKGYIYIWRYNTYDNTIVKVS